jgi:superfamily II DNA/RNA helicase
LTFDNFNFDTKLSEGLYSMGYTSPTPIQEQAIPLILQGKDLIACAQTGTGKTAAFLLPVLHNIMGMAEEKRALNTLILSPTRELATQIDRQIEGLGYFTGISSLAIYGGNDGAVWTQQKKALAEGSNIIVATPGRLIALLQMETIDFSHLQCLVLDEADKMLDMGFYEDILKIISYLPKQRQTLLFSATMPVKIRTLANTILSAPEQITLAVSKPADGIEQQVFIVDESQKIALLGHILKNSTYSSIIVFASTKESVKTLEGKLNQTDISAKAFHSDLDQKEREEILRDFRNKTLQVLIGTDILSRGIDVEGVSLVINYSAPHDAEDYIHRIGRTARAETTGTAITFINEKDRYKLAAIQKLIGRDIPKMSLPEGFREVVFGESNTKPGSRNKKFFKKKNYKAKINK